MSEEDRAKIIKEMERRGAQIQIQDPRVTAVQNWIFATFGGSLLLVCAWVGNSIQDLNASVGKLSSQMQFKEHIDAAQDSRLTIYDNRLRDVEQSVYATNPRRATQ